MSTIAVDCTAIVCRAPQTAGPAYDPSDTPHVNVTWMFSRGKQRLTLERCEDSTGVELRIAVDGEAPRVSRFPTMDEVVPFQSTMERFLLQTGWTFVHFSPDRRAGSDRRTFPRIRNDRRRWWTDGQPQLVKGSSTPVGRR